MKLAERLQVLRLMESIHNGRRLSMKVRKSKWEGLDIPH
jgi:hypothetical protein